MLSVLDSLRRWVSSGALFAAMGLAAVSSLAQDTGYAVGENTADTAPDSTAAANASAGPVRMARFSYIQGNVTWRPDESSDWAAAPNNLPLKEGAQVWVANASRAEIQFDDGSYLRLGSGAIATVKVLFSDAEGEFTQISLTNGLAMLKIRHGMSVYQVDTPIVSAKADGPARLRLGVGSGVEVGVIEGSVAIEGPQGKATMKRDDFLSVHDAVTPYNVVALPGADSWENWNEERDHTLDGASVILASHNVPSNITLVAGDLGRYGSWRTDGVYGQVWCPTVTDPEWRPYYAGHWAWVNPFGWTWCSDEPWGWAPYHYGTWIHAPYGWAWVPGPSRQYWSPAVVSFSESNGSIAWCALAPAEVHYPAAISIGFAGGNWAAFFSIGMAGCYYPAGGAYCVGRAFNTVVVNRATYVTVINEGRPGGSFVFVENHNTYLAGRPFIPVNSRTAAGAVVSSEAAFGGRGSFSPVAAGSTEMFARGHVVSLPPSGRPPLAGPPAVRPTSVSINPARTFVKSASETSAAARRPVFGSTGSSNPGSVQSGVARPSGTGSTPLGSASPSRPGVGSSGGHPGEEKPDAVQKARDAVHSGQHDTNGSKHSDSGSSRGGSSGGKEGGGKGDKEHP